MPQRCHRSSSKISTKQTRALGSRPGDLYDYLRSTRTDPSWPGTLFVELLEVVTGTTLAATSCPGRTVPMENLDNLVAEYIERRSLQPQRLERLLSHVLDRRTERAEHRRSHIAELRKRAAEADAKLKRLYDAIENGIADLSDPMLKDRIGELKATRDQARLDAERAEDAIDRAGPSITAQALKTFARKARKRMRTENGGYRRDHLRALAQRVEVDQKERRIMGSKSVLLRTLLAAESAKTAGFGVPNSVPKWRARRDSNSRPSGSKSDALSS